MPNEQATHCSETRTEPTRVLLITGWFPPLKCGVGDYTSQLAAALARRKDTVVAVLTGAAARGAPSPPNVELLPLIKDWSVSDLAKVRAPLRNWHPDIVHMQFGSRGYRRRLLPWLFPALLAATGSSVVQTWHEYSGDPLRILRNLPNALTPGALIVVKPEYQKGMPSWYRRLIRNKNMRYVANGPAIPHVELDHDARTAIKRQFCGEAKRLVAFFGFANPRKGLDRLFDVVDPSECCLVLICDLDPSDAYQRKVLERMTSEPWAGNAHATGFLPAERVARLLSAADAVALPFPDGGGVWSTSAQAAMVQGTFVLVTSRERRGYDAAENVYYADPADVSEMRSALRARAGTRVIVNDTVRSLWDSIADAHMQVYRSQISQGRNRA